MKTQELVHKHKVFHEAKEKSMMKLNYMKIASEFLNQATWPLKKYFVPRFPKVKADRILAIACTGHGASLAYMDSSGILRSTLLERWTGVKYMLMFSADEENAIRYPQNDIDKSINFVFSYRTGKFPDCVIFEESFIPWMEWMLRDIGVRAEDIDLVITSNGHFATGWIRLGPELKRWFPNATIVRSIEHHEIHQRQAFWQSGFDEAAVLTLDTCGEPLIRLGGKKLSGTISTLNQEGKSKIYREFLFPESSPGLIYDTTTYHVGFPQGEEGKTMGLAQYGEPELFDRLKPELKLHEDGSFRFMDDDKFKQILEEYVPRRQPKGEMTQRHMNVAYAGQTLIDLIVINAWQAALNLTGKRKLVYAGGLALNSVANDKAYRAVKPDAFYIPPSPGDPGHALGCVLFGAYEIAGWPLPQREVPEYLGPTYSLTEIETVAHSNGYPTSQPDDLLPVIARCIANGHIVGRFDGSAEFGPRALGNRSILVDPRRPGMKDYLNSRVKHREAFRPFAPTVLEEYAGEWFDLSGRSSYMLRVVPILPDKIDKIPAVAHVDGTARVQTLASHENPGYYQLIRTFHELTGVPLVLNTSFNIAGKPIVEKPEDALECFEKTEIDILVMGPYIISKQPLEYYLNTNSLA
jgi:carbamoyltransferase